MLGLHETSKGEEDLVTEHGEWEVGSLGVGGWKLEVWGLEVIYRLILRYS